MNNDTIMRTMTTLTADLARIPNLDEAKAEALICKRLSPAAMTAVLAGIVVEDWLGTMPVGAAANVTPLQPDEPWHEWWGRVAEYDAEPALTGICNEKGGLNVQKNLFP